MNYRVRITAEALGLIDELDTWWEENRPASRVRLSDEMEPIFATLAEMPRRGSLYSRLHGSDIRQYRVRGTPYSLYYVVDDEAAEVVVISAWSRLRGKGPSLR